MTVIEREFWETLNDPVRSSPGYKGQVSADDEAARPPRSSLLIIPRRRLGSSIPHPRKPRRRSSRLPRRPRNRRLHGPLHALLPNTYFHFHRPQHASHPHHLHGVYRATQQPAVSAPAGPSRATGCSRGDQRGVRAEWEE